MPKYGNRPKVYITGYKYNSNYKDPTWKKQYKKQGKAWTFSASPYNHVFVDPVKGSKLNAVQRRTLQAGVKNTFNAGYNKPSIQMPITNRTRDLIPTRLTKQYRTGKKQLKSVGYKPSRFGEAYGKTGGTRIRRRIFWHKHSGHRNVRVRRGAHGRFAGSY